NCAPIGAFEDEVPFGLVEGKSAPVSQPASTATTQPCNLGAGLGANSTGTFYFEGPSNLEQSPLVGLPAPRFVPVSPVEVPSTQEPSTTEPPTTEPPTTKTTVP